MSARNFLGLAAAAMIGACATAPQGSPAPPSTAAPALSLDTLKTVTQQLSSDAFQGRAPTTAGEEKTVALIADRFQKAGL